MMIYRLFAAFLVLPDRLRAARAEGRDRGDVPGWVLITLMTAGLVTALWAVAGPTLTGILSRALSSVTGP